MEVSIAIWGVEEALFQPDDPVLKQIEEKTGVKLVPQNVTWGRLGQKDQLWATNGQLPDILPATLWAKSLLTTGSSRA